MVRSFAPADTGALRLSIRTRDRRLRLLPRRISCRETSAAGVAAMTGRVMSLTTELVARVHRQIEDSGPSPDVSYLGDEDYATMVEVALADHPDGSPLWLFAYGSLIWKPEIEYEEERVAR